MVGSEGNGNLNTPDDDKVKQDVDKEHQGDCVTDVSPTGRTDNRKKYEWQTKYPSEAKKEMRIEGGYLIALFVLSFVLIFLNWNIWLPETLSVPQGGLSTFKKYAYYSAAGLLGGVVFDTKNFYRAIASGWWNLDRRAWRILSPLLGFATAFMVGAMLDSNLLESVEPTNSAAHVFIGFISGYSADKAIAKMGDIAHVIFGKTNSDQSSAATKPSKE